MKRFQIVWMVLLIAAGLHSEEKASEAAAPDKPTTLKLLTYNVLADEVSVKKRVPALFKILNDSDADIIVLQEVAPWFFRMMYDEPFIKKYQLIAADNSNAARGEYVILSKRKLELTLYEALESKQRRGFFMAKLKLNGRTLAIGTSHLESFLEDGPARAKQLDSIFERLKDADDAIFMGDFNFGEGEHPDTSHLDKKYADAWLALKPKDPGYTWNIEQSDMAKDGSFPDEKSRRLDRILVRSDVWKAESIEIIGNKPLNEGKKDLFPSDHFGLTATVKFKPEKE